MIKPQYMANLPLLVFCHLKLKFWYNLDFVTCGNKYLKKKKIISRVVTLDTSNRHEAIQHFIFKGRRKCFFDGFSCLF